jgi:hypothetical protein
MTDYDTLRWLRQRTEHVLTRPGMWGSAETVEVLLLEHLNFEVALTTHPAKAGDAEAALRNAWSRWVVEELGFDTGARSLAQHLASAGLDDRAQRVADAMRLFRKARPWDR